MGDNNYIWIFGENHGSTANNNAYFFWKHVVNIRDDIEKYIVFEKNDNTKKVYESLSGYEKGFVLWKNSSKHIRKYQDADIFLVCTSYKDITPSKIMFKQIKCKIKKPVIYLRHGTAGMKSTYYDGRSYWNNMFKFLSFNREEIPELIEKNNFERHQIFSADYLPRYGEFIKKDEAVSQKNQILWFITWREYFEANSETKLFVNNVKNVLKSQELTEFLKDNNLILKLCVHQFFDKKTFKGIYKHSKKGIIEIVHSKDVDVMDELVKSSILITDYSSVAYDFAILDRPILLYQPDLEIYNRLRDFICDIEVMKKYNITEPKELVRAIVNGDYKVNPFFRNNWPENIDYDYIKSNRHIDRMYESFAKMQKNKITILGLNFFEHGNLANSTMSMVQMLADEGYMVELISLYRQNRYMNPPNGVTMKYLYWNNSSSFKEKISRKLHSRSSQGYLKYEHEISRMDPSVAYYLDKLMKNIRTSTIISTAESLHLYLDECKSDKVKNKIYLFNRPANYNPDDYKILLDKIKGIDIEKSIFITERDADFFENCLNFKTPSSKLIFDDYIVENQIAKPNLGSDFLDENFNLKDVDAEELDDAMKAEYTLLKNLIVDKKDSYNGISLVGFDEFYCDDLNNIIEFGKYLRENDIKNITLDVVGKGDYALKFIDLIAENNLFGYINFLGNNLNIIKEIQKHDFVLNLSRNPTSNVAYFQGVLNYKKVFCFKNERSSEIFKDIPNTFIESYDWLCRQIADIHQLSLKDFDDYHNLVAEKNYGKIFGEKLIRYIED